MDLQVLIGYGLIVFLDPFGKILVFLAGLPQGFLYRNLFLSQLFVHRFKILDFLLGFVNLLLKLGTLSFKNEFNGVF